MSKHEAAGRSVGGMICSVQSWEIPLVLLGLLMIRSLTFDWMDELKSMKDGAGWGLLCRLCITGWIGKVALISRFRGYIDTYAAFSGVWCLGYLLSIWLLKSNERRGYDPLYLYYRHHRSFIPLFVSCMVHYFPCLML